MLPDHDHADRLRSLFLGPTINDALANMGKTSANEMTLKYGHIGFQWKHEYEADLAGMRWVKPVSSIVQN